MRLALALGCTAGELGDRMGCNEFTDWLAFERLYGLPDGYFVAGQVCSTMANLWSKGSFGPEDFVPYFKPPRRRQTVREMRQAMKGAADRARV